MENNVRGKCGKEEGKRKLGKRKANGEGSVKESPEEAKKRTSKKEIRGNIRK